MSEEKMNLARRAVACPGWRWLPGMRHTTMIKGEEWFCCRVAEKDAPREPRHPDALPDLDDPATLGCLLALVREAWPMAPATTARCVGVSSDAPRHRWMCSVPTPCSYASNGPPEWRALFGDSEAEALVAALEAAGR